MKKNKLPYYISSLFIIPLCFVFVSYTRNKQEDSGALFSQLRLIESELSLSNITKKTERATFLKKLESTVIRNGNKAAEIKIKNEILTGMNATDALLKYMDDLKESIVDRTGGYGYQGNELYIGARDLKITSAMMIGLEDKENGEGYKLALQLRAYKDKLKLISKSQNKSFDLIGVEPKEDPRITEPLQKEKDFVDFNFKGTPMMMMMVELERMESEILRYEKEFYEEMATFVSKEITYDKLIPVVRSSSNIVAAGTKYEAEIFLASTSSSITPTMNCRGSAIQVDPSSKRGKVSFIAQAGGAFDAQENAFKQRYSYGITIKYKGKDTTFIGQEDYFVKKPLMHIQSQMGNLLYQNCGNEFNITVPDLGYTYNPSFSALGADVIKGAKNGSVTLVPTSNVVELKISSNGNFIGSESFKTISIPLPKISVFSDNKPMDEKAGMDAKLIKTITVKAIPDEGFKNFFPKDARYRVAEWECTLVRGKRPIGSLKANSESQNISVLIGNAQLGDRLLIEVKQIMRTNYLNKVELVNTGESIVKNIPLY